MTPEKRSAIEAGTYTPTPEEQGILAKRKNLRESGLREYSVQGYTRDPGDEDCEEATFLTLAASAFDAAIIRQKIETSLHPGREFVAVGCREELL